MATQSRDPPEPPAFLSSTTPPEGPTFVIIRKVDGSFQKDNPFAIRRELIRVCGEIESAKIIRSGALMVRTFNGDQATYLLTLKKFLGAPCKTLLADRLNSVQGVVKSDSLVSLTNKELLSELADQGVVRVERLRSKDPTNPNPSIRLNFSGQELPQIIYCGYLVVRVEPWVPGPLLCRKCWHPDHTERTCHKKQPRCGRCGAIGHAAKGETPEDDCTATPYCVNCERPHPAWTWDCGFRVFQRAEHRDKIQRRRAEHRYGRRDRTAPLSQEEWPELPPPGRRANREAPTQAPIRRTRRENPTRETPPQPPPRESTPADREPSTEPDGESELEASTVADSHSQADSRSSADSRSLNDSHSPSPANTTVVAATGPSPNPPETQSPRVIPETPASHSSGAATLQTQPANRTPSPTPSERRRTSAVTRLESNL